MTTYSESAEGVMITRQRAIKEMDDHGVPPQDRDGFFNENKPDAEGLYSATDVLNWLGY